MIEFKEWLKNRIKSEGFISKGKAQASLFKPGPRDIRPKPHDVKACGVSGGPGPCQQQ
jgi:hypothetical protein